MVDASVELGKVLGKLSVSQSATNEQLSGDDSAGSIGLYLSMGVKVSGVLKRTKYFWASTTLVFDHPVNGDLDVFAWDVGYSSSEALGDVTL